MIIAACNSTGFESSKCTLVLNKQVDNTSVNGKQLVSE